MISRGPGRSDNAGHCIGLSDQGPVRYCEATEGVSLAYTHVGSGPPLVFAGAWMTHLERERDDPAWGHYLSRLAEDFLLIRYDQRGNGMSDWKGVDISFERMVDDLGAVVGCHDHGKVAIYGASQAAVALGIRHDI